MKEFSGRVVAITGAGSGIGRALANNLSKKGAHLALSDINEEGLAETVGQGARCGHRVSWEISPPLIRVLFSSTPLRFLKPKPVVRTVPWSQLALNCRHPGAADAAPGCRRHR